MLPNKVKVAGVDYEVQEVENVIIDGSTNYAGLCNYVESRIEILADMSLTRKEQTLIHEVLHACFYEAGFIEQEEDVINRVSNVLYQVLKENNFQFGNGGRE